MDLKEKKTPNWTHFVQFKTKANKDELPNVHFNREKKVKRSKSKWKLNGAKCVKYYCSSFISQLISPIQNFQFDARLYVQQTKIIREKQGKKKLYSAASEPNNFYVKYLTRSWCGPVKKKRQENDALFMLCIRGSSLWYALW